jgi:hypothetical protein
MKIIKDGSKIDLFIRRMICRVAGHIWSHEDDSMMNSTEPQIRAVCAYCGHNGGLI